MTTPPTTSPAMDDIVVRHVPGGVVVESRRRPGFDRLADLEYGHRLAHALIEQLIASDAPGR